VFVVLLLVKLMEVKACVPVVRLIVPMLLELPAIFKVPLEAVINPAFGLVATVPFNVRANELSENVPADKERILLTIKAVVVRVTVPEEWFIVRL